MSIETVAKEQITEYESRLRSGLPDFEFDHIEIVGDGWDHVAVEVSEVIFRLPKEHNRNSAREDHVRYETRSLKLLQSRLGVAVPNPIYISQDFEFFGYPKLKGILANEAKSKFDPKQVDQYLDDWAKLAAAIHASIPLDEAKRLGIPELDFEKHKRQAATISTLDNVPEFISDFAQSVLEAASKVDISRYPKVFLHNDLHSANIMLEPNTLRINGVIDWSDIQIGPPESEFSRLIDSDHVDINELAQRYAKLGGSEIDVDLAKTLQQLLWARVYYYQSTRGNHEGAEETAKKIQDFVEHQS